VLWFTGKGWSSWVREENDWSTVLTERRQWRTAAARAGTRAREGRRGLAYERMRRSVGVGRNVPAPLGRVGRRGHGWRCAPLRRPMARRGRCAGRRIRATWSCHLPRTAHTGARRHCAVTSGHKSASACAPEAGTARTAVADVAAHDAAPWTRSGALGPNVFHGSVFKIVFLQFSKLNCTLASRSKVGD
jgi:hypothetical protein